MSDFERSMIRYSRPSERPVSGNTTNPWGSRKATPDEVDACVQAINHANPGVIPPGQIPAEVTVAGSQEPKSFYVNVVPREKVPIGTVYRTWIVVPGADGETTVSWFRSRRGERGDDTLPPSDDAGETLPP
jgi:hypothetical protein